MAVAAEKAQHGPHPGFGVVEGFVPRIMTCVCLARRGVTGKAGEPKRLVPWTVTRSHTVA